MIAPRQRPGLTLLELIAALSILGTIASVTVLMIRSAEPVEAVDDATARIRAARRDALRLRRPVSIEFRLEGTLVRVTAMPDGRIVGDAAAGGYRMTGFQDAWN